LQDKNSDAVALLIFPVVWIISCHYSIDVNSSIPLDVVVVHNQFDKYHLIVLTTGYMEVETELGDTEI